MADAAVVDRGDTLTAPEVDVPEVDTPETPEVKTPDTPEVEATVETPEVKERDDSGRFIPKGRFDEAVSKERGRAEVAERKLAELQASLKQVDRNADAEKLESEIVGLEQQHAKLLLDGDHEQAAKVMGQIRLKERTIAIQESANLSVSAKNELREELRMDTAIEMLESTYDVFNPAHADFDQDMVDFVLSSQATLIQSERLSPSAALVKAAQKVLGKFAGAGTKAVEPGLAAGKAQDRKAGQVAKNIAAAAKQPASMKESGIDSDKAGQVGDVDYTKLTADERAALPAATRARLRGDTL